MTTVICYLFFPGGEQLDQMEFLISNLCKISSEFPSGCTGLHSHNKVEEFTPALENALYHPLGHLDVTTGYTQTHFFSFQDFREKIPVFL